MKTKPVHIITSFLGAGKTTFLNHFIKERLPERIFVIENECGATNVDGALIMDGTEEIVELTSGCLCCSLADGLLDILQDVYNRRDEYDRLVIETTGIADPSSIVQVFLENPAVEKAFSFQQVICLVDAGLVVEWLDEAEEALRQIAIADVLLVNKIDQIAEGKLHQVLATLNGINPQAKSYTGYDGIFPIEDILQMGTINPEAIEAVTNTQGHHHFQHGETNNHKISTFTLDFSHPLDLNELQLDLNRIIHLYRHQVYRVKGVIAIPHYPNRVILQSVRSTFVATDGTPWEDENNREGRLVFIGRGLKKEAFEKMFNQHLVFPSIS
ncbi:GTP-binding protein [Reichenbachiella carrageenanivorans]|uniref:GTP-binding protein n=1 Tax=Reichenbachiella carrageenanivorans TaxID=2979869 RepID=A0ABY6CY12_9BACT|nr:GTP-binding protein [Reichenbachiella carrageenanivorans]UXX78807.1 GTP-binding protein [Reichenbachiella carrageenanivorans]